MTRLIGAVLFVVIRSLLLKVEPVYGFEYEKHAEVSAQLVHQSISVEEDIRVIKLEKYLAEHNSPLIDNAEDFVRYADAHNFGENWSLVAAIAGVESTFGKRIPHNSYNAWGWGIPTGHQSGIGFTDWEDGIETVTTGLKKNYMDKGATDLSTIGRIYAPPSTTWAHNVRFFMNKIEQTPIEPTLTI